MYRFTGFFARPAIERPAILPAGAADWLFIDYVTWAGPIDSVYGLGSSGGRAFGPVGESDGDKMRAAYLELMGAFGVADADALNFPPFVRGFWGE